VINQITTAEAQALGFVSLEHLECSHQPHAQDRGAKKRTQSLRCNFCSKFARRTKNAAEPWGPAARCRCLLDGETRTL